MSPVDHLFSELRAVERRFGDPARDPADLIADAERSFARLAVPIVGDAVSDELASHWRTKYAASARPDFGKLGDIAAFLAGEEGGQDPALDAADWTAIADAVNAEADEMDLETLTRLMAGLVEKGALD